MHQAIFFASRLAAIKNVYIILVYIIYIQINNSIYYLSSNKELERLSQRNKSNN